VVDLLLDEKGVPASSISPTIPQPSALEEHSGAASVTPGFRKTNQVHTSICMPGSSFKHIVDKSE
jgi:hypothetical protein